MKKNLLLASLFIISQSCSTSEVVEAGIKDQALQGTLNKDTPFTFKTAICQKEKVLGEDGYTFFIFDTTQPCGSKAFQPIRFFLPKLELVSGTFKGKSLSLSTFKSSTNFSQNLYGDCDIVITNVTATSIEGKLKGGDTAASVEGKFTATICK